MTDFQDQVKQRLRAEVERTEGLQRQEDERRQAATERYDRVRSLREAVTGPLETAFELAPTRIVICGDGEAQNLAAAARRIAGHPCLPFPD